MPLSEPAAHIRYTIAASALERVLLAVTARGVCAVALADTDAELERFLRDEFPGAEAVRDDAGLSERFGELMRAVAGEPYRELTLDVRATPFQRKVWEELRRIPRGTTRTYGQLAESLGRPTATRAVARACATNPVAVLVPCHRVIGGDGKLHGYRWGLQRKQRLLELERPTE
jgi:AraC family transcriptional regulator of adaptative response/methylated-DNA-[protein]-cysteine methyltransferase